MPSVTCEEHFEATLKRYHWETVAGDEIEDAVLRGQSAHDLVTPCEAIYLWRRCIVAPPRALQSRTPFMEWIDRTARIHFGVISQVALSHYINVDRLTVGGGNLSPDKVKTLKQWASQAEGRRLLAKFLSSTSQFLPPLYVGETINMAERAVQHVRYDTLFAEKLRDEIKLGWEDVALHYYCLGPQRNDSDDDVTRKSRRTLMEMILSRVGVAGCVTRLG